MKPLIKWAGGKTQLLSELLPLIPEFNVYYEPFFGGGALYFALEPKRAVLNDYNPQLMNLYKQCKKNPSELQKQLQILQSDHDDSTNFYYDKREEFNECIKNNELSIKSASLLVYLNKAGYNGLYRLNTNGQYNVPTGHRKKITLYDGNNIAEVSLLLKKAKLLTGDFEKACKQCKEGDFVFFDSPYYNTFDTYQANGFGVDDHIRLSELYEELTKKKVKCLLTNSNETFIKDLYKQYKIKVVEVNRMINSNGTKRKGTEVIITNY